MTSVLKVDNIQNSSGTDAISIDSSGKIDAVSKKNSFVLLGATGTAGYTEFASGTVAPLNQVYQSKGTGASDYSTTTYKYTAPCDGIYMWTFKGIAASAAKDNQWSLYVNDTYVLDAMWGYDQRGFSGSSMIYLDKDDTLHFQSESSQAVLYRTASGVGSQNAYTYASIGLLREL